MKFRRSSGFALPTVLVVSVVMMIVLLVAVTSTASVRVALTSQYYNQLSKTAGEAGVAYAKACLSANNGVSQWSNAQPLKPNTDCTGTALAGVTCPSADTHCSVVSDGNVSSTFSVGLDQLTTPNGGWSQVVSGYYHTCAIAISNSKIYCWGNNSSGQLGDGSIITSPIPTTVDTSGVLSGLTIKAIAAGGYHTCVIASDDRAYCWGNNGSGQLGNNSTTNSSIPVAVDTSGVLNGLTVKAISAGYNFTCAIASDNNTYCWGDNSYGGQLGNNSSTSSSVPVAVTTSGVLSGLTVKAITSSDYHTCVIASNNNAYCWGYGSSGSYTLGTNSVALSRVPVAVTTSGVLSGLTINSISAGGEHTCVVASNNKAYCWGTNRYGQLGNNSTTNSSTAVAVTTSGVLSGLTVKAVASGDSHTCAVASNNNSYCWGLNSYGQLGNNSTTNSLVPVTVTTSGALSGLTIKFVTAGSHHNCTVASNDKIYCWGYNSYGQLGASSYNNSSVAVSLNITGAMINDITSIGTTNLSRTTDNTIWRQYTQATRFNSVKKTSQSQIVLQAVDGGLFHTCAIASDNKAYCWGNNGNGQLGINSTTSKFVPVAVISSGVLAGKTIKAISPGFYHTCAIASDNKAYCWGSGYNGQLGDNTTDQDYVPVAVSTSGALSGLGITAIAAGGYHNCVIASNNKAYCWGADWSGQLGNNSTSNSSVPVAVTTSGVLSGLTIKAISNGESHTCAIASNDKVYCWGDNSYGQLGNNSTTDSSVPVAVTTSGVLSGLTIKALSLGGYHTCVIASNNKTYCWGYNTYRQLGNNSTSNSSVPVAVTTSGVLSGLTIKFLSAGGYHNCVVASNNNAYCWGRNDDGQLGNNSTNNSSTPVAVNNTGVLSGLTLKSIAAGFFHNCVIASDDNTYCWGENALGALGNNSTNQSSVPVMTLVILYYDTSIYF